MTDLVGALGELAAQYGAWVRLHYGVPVSERDEVIPMMAEGPLKATCCRIWMCRSSTRIPSAQAHETPGERREGA